MDTDAIYRMSGRVYTYDELVDALNAEAATLPPETWRGGEFNLKDYLIEAMQAGIIEIVDFEGDFGDPDGVAAATGSS
jgi:hypothetical protein